MSNKTSDKNVANIEDDVNKIKEIIKRCENFNKNLGYESEIYDGDLPIPYKSLQHILAEREQKDKRIQELEEESKKKSIELICYQEELENSIPTQVVIDKIKDLKLSGGSNGKDNVENLVRELTIEILQELLEGERK